MSIREQSVRYGFPEQSLSSSKEVRRGDEEYDPHAVDDDDELESQSLSKPIQNEQSRTIHPQKSDTPRMNNGTMPSVVMNEQSSEDQLRDRSRSPTHSRPKHSDRRPRSPYNRNHHLSDRKRLRPSSPSEQISSEKSKKSSRNESENKSKSPSPSHRQKYPSKSSDSNEDKPPSNGSENNVRQDNHVSRHSSKRDEYPSYRSHSSRHHHHSSSSRQTSRDHSSSSSHQSYFDRRTSNSSENVASPSRVLSTTSDSQTTESKERETSSDGRSRICNRLRNANDTNNHHTDKSSGSTSQTFNNTNGASQRARSNLIQIVTTIDASASKQIPPVRLSSAIIKPEPVQSKPLAGPSLPAKVESKPSVQPPSASSRKTNGGTADDMLMEEMLLEEEQEQAPVKSIDLDSLTIPETTTQQKLDPKNEPAKITTITTTAATAVPSPTKKLYKLYKVPHTNHTTPPLSSRHKKPSEKDASRTQSNPIVPNAAPTDERVRPTSLDERISTILGAPSIATNSQNEPTIETRANPPPPPPTLSTPSDRSTESPQEIPALISTMFKKGQEHSIVPKKSHANDERRSISSKHYTSEWLASQKPEEATAMPTEELPLLPPLVMLPTLGAAQVSTTSTKPSISTTTETNTAATVDKLTEVMSKLIQKQKDSTVVPITEGEEAVPISAKHLERSERRKQREKRQSEIAAIAKEALKPAFRKHDITKEEYKEIMKKVVTKATQANEIDRVRIGKMINAYVEKYRPLREKLSQAPSTSNGNHL